MLLSRRILAGNILLLIGLLALVVTPLCGLLRVLNQVDVAVHEYTELRLVQRAALHVALAESEMVDSPPDPIEIQRRLTGAAEVIREYVGRQPELQVDAGDHDKLELEIGRRSLASLTRMAEAYSPGNPPLSEEAQRDQLRTMGQILKELDHLVGEADALVAATHQRAAGSVRNTLLALALLGAAVVGLGTFIGVRQYRRVINPLGAIRRGVRTIASGGLSARVPETGDREFLELAADFNAMAAQLEGLYRGLEEKVAIKSRELVQSERLASVGFLAAGVAHEINNPLNIISGYAELSLRQLGRSSGPDAVSDALRTLQIVRDEAFRCKGITEKLLSLSAPSDSARGPVPLARVTAEVFEMLRHFKRYRDRKFSLRHEEAADLTVLANETEIKQVLLNLIVNAIEATESDRGQVHVEITRDDRSVRLAVNDNGHGMTPEICQRVFEPFFSGKRADGNRGIGLGLSISHAIVASHQGRLSAESDGPGRGSRFTLELPGYAGGSAS